jgi:hypothetical protein
MVTLHEATSDLIMPTVLQTADRGTTHKLSFEMLTALFAIPHMLYLELHLIGIVTQA